MAIVDTCYVVGNENVPGDFVPLTIVSDLTKRFPQVKFTIKDPNEEWPEDSSFIVIDTVKGVESTKVIDDLSQFIPSPRFTMHDHDVLSSLLLQNKIGRLGRVIIVAIPYGISSEDALESASTMIKNIINEK